LVCFFLVKKLRKMVHIAILVVLWFVLVNPSPSSMEVWEGKDPRQASCYEKICCEEEEECRKPDSWKCDCSEHLHCEVLRVPSYSGGDKYIKVIGKCHLEEKKMELIKKSVERCTGDKCTGYRGIKAMTQGGSICRYWSDVDNSDGHLGSFDENGLDENYCRNPNGLHDDIWCYTEEDWEYCSLDNDCQSTCVHGTCTVNACKCEWGYKGDNCNEDISVYCDSTWKAGNHKTSDPKTCKIYAEREYCAGGTYGSGWDNGWGTFENYADSKGRTALVCLECGCKADDLRNWFSRANNNNNN